MIHILVVDDDAKLNKTVCTYLNDCGFETKGVLNAQEAFETRRKPLKRCTTACMTSSFRIS